LIRPQRAVGRAIPERPLYRVDLGEICRGGVVAAALSGVRIRESAQTFDPHAAAARRHNAEICRSSAPNVDPSVARPVGAMPELEE
jgi:hypothetical protein